MALFVHPENQKILWNIINGNPFIIRYFESRPPHIKETWFKQSIEEFYKKIQGRKIDPAELNNLNKELLTSMIQDVHMNNPEYSAHNSSNIQTNSNNMHNQQWHQSQPYQYPQNNQYNAMNTINTPQLTSENKEEIFKKQFQMRQQEYESMFQRNVPAEINFRDTTVDENKDVNELLEREKREREELMKPIQQNNKINIQGDNNIKIEAVELPEPKDKKSVTWSNDNKMGNIQELFEVQKSEMYSMRLHIIELTKQLDETNKRISGLELQLQQTNVPTTEKQQYVTSKYANLDENKGTSVSNQSTDTPMVFVETVESDSDSPK
jgi:hypothetical protein